MYEKTGMILRFAIGEVPAEHTAAVQHEEKQHGSFLRIPIEQVPIVHQTLRQKRHYTQPVLLLLHEARGSGV